MIRPGRAATAVVALAMATAVALSAAGCGGDSTSSGGASTGGGAPSGALADGGVLRFALESTPTSLDPSQMIERSAGIVALQFGEGLFEVGQDGKTVPDLATGYETSADGRTMKISLQEGVRFSNGQPMTSKDVAFSIEQARKSPFNGSLYEAISKVSTPSPQEVVLKLKSPSPGLPSALANYSAFVIPADFAGMTEKAFAQNPIGTGPYAVSSGQRGRDIKMLPNAHYWKETKPNFDEIHFTVATDENSRLQQIRGGDLDMTPATLLGTKTALPPNSGARLEPTPQKVVNYMMLNQDFALFEDPRVRKAINLALDREGIVATATDGQGELGASFMPPSQAFFLDAKPPAPDVAAAKKLIAEATGNGADTEFTVRFYDFDAYSRLATQVIQQNLEEIGLTVKLEPLDEAALNELLETGEYEAVVGLYLATLVDPVGLSKFYLSFFAPHSGQDVKALTAVSEEAAVETDEAKREQLYDQLQEMMIEEEGLLVLNYQPEVYAVTDAVSGIEFDGAGNLLLRNAGFAE